MSGILAEPRTRGEGLIVDSLPAIDPHLNEPGMRETVDSLIVAEMTRMQTDGAFDATTYLDGTSRLLPATRFASELVERELQLMQQGQRTQPQMNLTAYDQSPEYESLESLERAVRLAEVSLEAQMSRTINTELSAKYGTDQWKMANGQLEGILQAARSRVAQLTARSASIESSRVATQQPHGQRLATLAKRHAEVVENNFATELACVDAEREVKRLRGLAAALVR